MSANFRIGREFFSRKPEKVAKEFLGKLLVRKKGKYVWVGKIVETEAYLGPDDKASHSHRGKTERNKIMFGEAGHAYIYFTYGMHWLLNFITESSGKPSGVLIRALEPLYGPDATIKKVAGGPAKLTKWMQIDKLLNDTDVIKSENLFVAESFSINKQIFKSEKIKTKDIASVARIGVNYAGEHAELPLRFYIKGNEYISKP